MQKNDDYQSGFLEAPFVRMLRMRSASLKMFGKNKKKNSVTLAFGTLEYVTKELWLTFKSQNIFALMLRI